MQSPSHKIAFPSSQHVIYHKLEENDVKAAKSLAKKILNTYDKDKNGVLCEK